MDENNEKNRITCSCSIGSYLPGISAILCAGSKPGWGRAACAASRVVNLSFDADLEKADAQYKDGILTVSVPKKEGAQAQSKKLTIQRK